MNNKTYFYNPVTGEPINPDEDVDIYEKIHELIRPDDQKIRNTLLYEDCYDLSPKEKNFFVLWNTFITEYKSKENYLPNINIEDYLEKFIEKNLDYLKENELINELTLFMIYLLDIGEISLTFLYKWTIKIN